MLSDLGAEVIKIEAHQMGGDPSRHLRRVVGIVDCQLPHGRNAFFESLNRGKSGITVDLKHPLGKEVVYRLAKNADVFLENFRPGVADRLGVGYKDLSALNPSLVYGSASGFGPLGPDSGRPVLDYVGQARSGLMWNLGQPGDPPVWTTMAFADMIAGIMLGYGVVAALTARGRHGVGQKVDVSHLSSAMWLQYWGMGVSLLTGIEEFPRFGRTQAGNPMWNHYQCADGEWIVLALLQGERFWPDFCQAVGRPDLELDPRFLDDEGRFANCRELVAILDQVFVTKTREEWMTDLGRYKDFLFERVQKTGDLLQDPQVMANGYIGEMDHPSLGRVKVLNSPFQFSATPARLPEQPAPTLGEHTEEVLRRVAGYSDADIAELAEEGVV
jgi:formyl-CoA transferase